MSVLDELEMVAQRVITDPAVARRLVSELVRHFGGCRIQIPPQDYAGRNRSIRELFHAGVPVAQLARQYQLNRQSIYRIIGE